MLQGKIDSIQALQADYLKDTQVRIKQVAADIKHLAAKPNKTIRQANKLHQLQRLLVRLKGKLQQLTKDRQHNRVRLCFGGKKLFKQQFNLVANQYNSQEQWRTAWRAARSNQFYIIGSKDETMGNQSCMALINCKNNTIDLKIRVPHCLENKYGKHIIIPGLGFKHGHAQILAAINCNITRSTYARKSHQVINPNLYKQYGQAINYRLLRDAKGWRVFVTCDMQQDKLISDQRLGAIGIDINIDHLAVSEIDRHGNLVNSFKVNTCTYGKTRNQARAIIGDAVKVVIAFAVSSLKPIVIEKLDFSKKKQQLSFNKNKKSNRQLSSFTYAAITQCILSKAFKLAIDVQQVNPAFSSIIGRVKFAKIYNISIHQAAAMVIARRLFNFSERLPRCWDNIPNNTGGRLTLTGLVKIQGRHVWHTWAKVGKNLQMVLAAQYQAFIHADKLRHELTGQLAF